MRVGWGGGALGRWCCATLRSSMLSPAALTIRCIVATLNSSLLSGLISSAAKTFRWSGRKRPASSSVCRLALVMLYACRLASTTCSLEGVANGAISPSATAG